MKPLYKWPGGKAKEIQSFKKYYPDNFHTYVEPFFGAGAVYFDLNYPNNIINDLNDEVITFLSMIQKGKGDELYDMLSRMKNEEKEYYKIRAYVPRDEIEIAARFYYMRKTCFRGLIRYNKSGGFNVPYGNYKTYNFDELKDNEYVKILQNTRLFSGEFGNIFRDFNDESYFFFLDPPYHDTFSDYNSDGFNLSKHEELATLFKDSKSKCLMVIGKTPFIEELYKGYIVEEYSKKYAMTTYSKTVDNSFHLIVKNY